MSLFDGTKRKRKVNTSDYPNEGNCRRRGDAYGFKRHERYNLILQCFRLWGDQQLHPPDRWDINAYETADLPDPNAEAKEQAREMRKAGKELSEISRCVDFPEGTVSKWCRGIDPKATLKAKARKMDNYGKMKRKDIAQNLGVSVQTLRRWIGKK